MTGVQTCALPIFYISNNDIYIRLVDIESCFVDSCRRFVDFCRWLIDFGRRLVDSCRRLVDFSRRLVDSCRWLVDFGRRLVDFGRRLNDFSRRLVDPCRCLIDSRSALAICFCKLILLRTQRREGAKVLRNFIGALLVWFFGTLALCFFKCCVQVLHELHQFPTNYWSGSITLIMPAALRINTNSRIEFLSVNQPHRTT